MQDDFDPNIIEDPGEPREVARPEDLPLQETDTVPVISRAGKRLITFVGLLVIFVSAAFLIRDNVLVIRNLTVNGIKNIPWQTVALSAGLNASSNYFNLNENAIRSGINRNTGAGRTAADDEHIPDFVLFQLLETAFSPRISLCVEVHSYCSHPLDRATARPHCVVKNSR